MGAIIKKNKIGNIPSELLELDKLNDLFLAELQ